MTFTTKDSGKRVDFATGSRRDVDTGKPRYDLVGLHGLRRLAELMARGAEKYGERNWELGQPVSRSYGSALRHLIQYAEGDRSEDHLAAVAFNVFSIIHVEQEAGRLREGFSELLDLDFYGWLEEFEAKPKNEDDPEKNIIYILDHWEKFTDNSNPQNVVTDGLIPGEVRRGVAKEFGVHLSPDETWGYLDRLVAAGHVKRVVHPQTGQEFYTRIQ